jgi:hypothetical protein
MEYCKFILINNPQFKKEVVDYIKKSQYTNQKINHPININSICNEALGFQKD